MSLTGEEPLISPRRNGKRRYVLLRHPHSLRRTLGLQVQNSSEFKWLGYLHPESSIKVRYMSPPKLDTSNAKL